MGKVYEIKNEPRIVLKQVTCDDCDKDCTNASFDIVCKMSFSEESQLIKTICWDCYDEQYKELVIKQRNKAIPNYLLTSQIDESGCFKGHKA